MASEIEAPECLCIWLAAIGELIDPIKALIDTVVTLLQTVKAILALIPLNLSDELEKIALEVALSVLESAMGPIEAPFQMISRLGRAAADCPPIAHLAEVGDTLRTLLGVEALEELRFSIDEKIDAIQRESLKVQGIDDLIITLQDLKEAMDECGTNA